MPGLLDFFTSQDPAQQQGLLSATAALLRAGGPSRVPISAGQGIADALDGYQQGQQRARQQALFGLKVKDAQSDLANQELLRDQKKRIAARMAGDSQPSAGPLDAQSAPMASAMPGGLMSPKIGGLELPTNASATAAPRVNQTDAYVQRMMSIAQAHADEGDIDGATKIYEQVQKLRPKFSNDVTWVRGTNGKQVGLRFADDGSNQELDGYAEQQDPNKAFSISPRGMPVANLPYQQYELSKAKAGATNVTTKVETKAGESLAAQVGPILKDSATAAQGALGQIDAADRVIGAVNTGKIYAGPMASNRLSLAQLSQTLGVGGKDDAEKIENTRQVVRGLAELTLQGRKTMQGQGQITDKENELAQRAISGDIDNLTGPELIQIASASKRAAQYTVANHQRKLKIAQSSPGTAGIAGYFDAPAIPSSFTDPAPAAPKPAAQYKSAMKGQVMDGYRFKGGNPADPNAWEKL
jgi:hypothetical protein